MNNKFLSIFFLLNITFGFNVFGAPIPSNELYRSPDAFSYKLSPKGDSLVGYVVEKDQMVLELLDLDLKKIHVIIGFVWSNDVYLNEYYWIDNNTLYVRYKKNKYQEVQGFIDLNYNAKHEIKPKLRVIKAKGEILSALPEQENKVIFQKKTGNDIDDIKVYYTSTDSLVKNHFNRKNEFKNTLKNAFAYFPDNENNIKLAATLKKEKLIFWYLGDKEKKWLPFYEYNSLDYDFEPVDLLGDDKLAIISNKDSDLKALYEFDIKTKKIGKLLFQHPKYDLTSAKINNETKKLEYVQYFDHGQLTTEYFSEKNSEIYNSLKKIFPGKQFVIVSGINAIENKIIKVFSSNDPGSFYLYNKKSNRVKLIAKRFNDIERFSMSKSTSISVKTHEGKEIEALLTRPKKLDNKVLLVMPHGGPVGIRDYDYFNPEVQYFVSRGFSVLRVNFSGSSGYGKKFMESGKGQFGKKIESDISLVVEQVRQNYHFSKLCAIGASYGGYSAFMLSIYNPKIYDCVVAEYGIYDLALLFNESNLQREKRHIDSVIATVGKYDESLKDYSPFFLADKVSASVLLIAGKSDKVAPFEHTNRMKYRLKQYQADLETMFYEGVGHGQSKWRGNQHELAIVNDFLRRKLKLPMIEGESYKEILRDEYMLLSDSYEFDDFVKNDDEKSFYYLNKAAALGDSRAMFNIGSFYHQGRFVDKNIDEAVKWYSKSSNAGYASASFRLGDLYRLGDSVVKDAVKSQKYYKMALQQGKQKAALEIDTKACFKDKQKFNIEHCIEAFESAIKDDASNKRIWSLLTKFLWKTELSLHEKKLVDNFLKKNYKINIFSDVTLDMDDFGILINTRKTRQGVKVDDTVSKVKPKKGMKLGVEYQIETEQSEKKPKTLIKVKWTHPVITNPETQESKLESLSLQTVFLYGKNWRTTNYTWYQFNLDWEMVPGEWKVEFFSLDNKLLYTKKFLLLAEAKVDLK